MLIARLWRVRPPIDPSGNQLCGAVGSDSPKQGVLGGPFFGDIEEAVDVEASRDRRPDRSGDRGVTPDPRDILVNHTSHRDSLTEVIPRISRAGV